MEQPRRLKANEVEVGGTVGLWNGSPISGIGEVEVVADYGNTGYRGEHLYLVRSVSVYEDGETFVRTFTAALDYMVDPTPPPRPARRRAAPKAKKAQPA